MQHQILKRTALVLALSIIINSVTMFLSILGSGVMPISFSMLLLATLPISFAVAFISYFVRKRTTLIISALMVISFSATGRVFMHFLENGFEKAKSYASRIAVEVEVLHAKTGKWPADLKEIPMERRPHIDPEILRPYKSYEEDNIYIKIGGFYINYLTDKQPPNLSVGRRDINVTWNWKTSQWE
jgi:hypothetical protein